MTHEELKACREEFEKWFDDRKWADPDAMRYALYEAWQAAYNTRTNPPIANNEGLVKEIDLCIVMGIKDGSVVLVPWELKDKIKAALQAEPKVKYKWPESYTVGECDNLMINGKQVVTGQTIYGILVGGQFVQISKEEHDRRMLESKNNGIYEVTQIGDDKTPFNAIRVGACDCNHPNCKTCYPKGENDGSL